jgi:hypothetical protein
VGNTEGVAELRCERRKQRCGERPATHRLSV